MFAITNASLLYRGKETKQIVCRGDREVFISRVFLYIKAHVDV